MWSPKHPVILTHPMLLPSLPDPLSPGNVTLSRAEEQSSLQAHWSTPAGERDFYLVTLQEEEDGAPTRNISVDGDNSRVTFHGLDPGKQYSVQVTAVAGPYRASARSTAAWTRKQKARACPSEGVSATAWRCWWLEGGWWDGEGDCGRGGPGAVQCSGTDFQEQAVGQSSKICCPTVPPPGRMDSGVLGRLMPGRARRESRLDPIP